MVNLICHVSLALLETTPLFFVQLKVYNRLIYGIFIFVVDGSFYLSLKGKMHC